MLMELDAILAVTLGGTPLTGGRFSLAGSVLGALIIQTLTSTIYSIGVPPEVNMVVKAGVVFAVMLLQSAEFRGALRAARSSGRVPASRAMTARRRRCGGPRASHRRAATCRSLGTIVAVRARWPATARSLYTGFFSPQVFLNLLIDNAFLCIVAVGMTFVILSGGIDLSVGSVIALTTMVSAALVEQHHWSACAVIPLVLLMGTAFGALHGLADPALPAAALHRHAGRHVPRARAVLPDQHRLDQHHRRRLHRDLAGAHPAVGRRRSVTVGALIALATVAARRSGRALHRSSAAPSTRSAAARRRRC